jgi:hypothetical protein
MAAVNARVYIGNLPSDTDFLEIHNICAPYGQVTAIEVSGPVAFVDFANNALWEDLIKAYNGMIHFFLILF